MTPDPTALKAARSQVKQAEQKLQAALVAMRKGGWPESADHLLPILKQIRVWTQKDGWFDQLEKED